jgi:hypothetical protein
MIEHVSTQGKMDPKGGIRCFSCPNKTWTLPLNLHIWHVKNRQKRIRNEKVMAFQNIWVKNSKNKPWNTT